MPSVFVASMGERPVKGRRGHLVNLARRKIGAENVAARIGDEIHLAAAPNQFLAKRLRGKKMAAGSTGRQHDRTAAHEAVSLPDVIANPPNPRKGLRGALEHGPLRQGDNHAKRDRGREQARNGRRTRRGA